MPINVVTCDQDLI